ncbi:Ku protein [Paenibacillus sp. SC116]|uniref:Ku protein n=1 Tax=Paenibacillus sp. SC116 TaxID=2968986 RepID=UPI0035C689D0
MHAATEDKDISMKQIHRACGVPISLLKTCNQCNKELASTDLIKGYEFQKTNMFFLKKKN